MVQSAVAETRGTTRVSVSNLVKRYSTDNGELLTVDNVSFDVKQG